MASMPIEQKHTSRGGSRPPVSAHPAFPAVVALWFAALLGLGSLILPGALIERLVSASGIASLIPAAAPPLGFTARAAIALAATILGALIGLVAARRVARARTSNDMDDDLLEDLDLEDSGHKPFNAEMDLEEDGIEPDADEVEPIQEVQGDAPKKRRRALAMQEVEGPSEFLMAAPLPGSDELGHDILLDDLLDLDADAAFEEVEVTGPAEASEHRPERQEFIAPKEEPAERFVDESNEAAPEPLHFSPPSMARLEEDGEVENDVRPFDLPTAYEPDAADESSVEESGDTDESFEDSMTDQQFFDSDPETSFVTEDAEPDQANATADEDSVENDGLVQLVQKLGNTLEKHREWSAKRAAEATAPVHAAFDPSNEVGDDPAPVPQMFEAAPQAEPAESAPAVPQVFEAAPPEDAAEAMAAYFSKPTDSDPEHPTVPRPAPGEAYAPLSANMRLGEDVEDEDDDDLDEIGASFSLPLKQQVTAPEPQTATPTPRPAFDIPPPSPSLHQPATETDDTSDGEDSDTAVQSTDHSRDAAYGSLSSVSNPFKQNASEFVRIEDAEPAADAPRPAVVFPHQETRQSEPVANAAPASQARKAASNDDNERALREALMNLQRMGK
ncbi:hypothetical protein [Aurantiacibacter sediminis]|uniref:Uncharacterized protein n=1 Tax=Aurantiacibacter sediminis TaxID=2793064 RepID=A0ABS0MZT8_9SPHN|nr:hypothetical protein [Aurantiacibacter sediminis]MBH5321223.1 hypothetical protein [Aurantiacibacter sediminis]